MWRLSDVEFYAMWTRYAKEGLPVPFIFTSKTRGGNEYRAELISARAALDERFGSVLDPFLGAMHKPDLSVAVRGWEEQEPLKPDGQLRVLAVRRGSQGYVIKCLPGESYWHGGRYVITACDPLRLADEAVAALPEMQPGARGEFVLSASRPADSDSDFQVASIKDSLAISTVSRAREFQRFPTYRAGTITVTQGESIYGSRGIKRHALRWRDIQDDGRYVITDQDPPVAVAADAQRTVGLINSAIASVIRVIREEQELHGQR